MYYNLRETYGRREMAMDRYFFSRYCPECSLESVTRLMQVKTQLFFRANAPLEAVVMDLFVHFWQHRGIIRTLCDK